MSNYCPSSFSSTLDRTKSLGCNRTYQYHCMRNKEDGMVEKCLKISWIQEDNCAVYDTDAKTIDAWPCDITRGVCPQEQYLSNEVMSYSACVPLSPPTNGTDERNVHEINTNDIQFESDGEGTSSGIIIAIVCIFVVCIALGVAGFIQFRRKRRGHTNEDAENIVPLIGQAGGHYRKDEEEQKNKHLQKEEEHIRFFEYKGEIPQYLIQRTKALLASNKNVLIIGKPGSGKTTLAWTLCKQMHGESFKGQRWYVKASTSARVLPDKEALTFLLLLDGRFENAWTTEGIVDKLFIEVEELKNKLSCKHMRTIATMSHEAYQRISKYGCFEKFKPMEIIDLDSKINALTNAEMTTVLRTYDISVKNVEDSKESRVLSQKQLQEIYERFNHLHRIWRRTYIVPDIGFPLIASLMSLYTPFIGNIEFVKEPIKKILESIKRLGESADPTDKNKYCTIVYASWNLGYVDTNIVNQDLLTKIGKRHDHPGAEIDPEVYVLRKRTATISEFLHETLLRAFFAAYGSQYMGFVIDNCPVQVLLEYSVLQRDNISDEEKVFFLTIGGIDYEKALIRRIRDANVDIRHHRIWENNRFQELYKKIHAKGDVSNKDINMESLKKHRIQKCLATRMHI